MLVCWFGGPARPSVVMAGYRQAADVLSASEMRSGSPSCRLPVMRLLSRPRSGQYVRCRMARGPGPWQRAVRARGAGARHGSSTGAVMAEPGRERVECPGQLAGDEPGVIAIAAGYLGQRLQVLVGEQFGVRPSLVDRFEYGADGLGLSLGEEYLRLLFPLGGQDRGLLSALGREDRALLGALGGEDLGLAAAFGGQDRGALVAIGAQLLLH